MKDFPFRCVTCRSSSRSFCLAVYKISVPSFIDPLNALVRRYFGYDCINKRRLCTEDFCDNLASDDCTMCGICCGKYIPKLLRECCSHKFSNLPIIKCRLCARHAAARCANFVCRRCCRSRHDKPCARHHHRLCK